MRQPSTFTQLHLWHQMAVAGLKPPRHEGIVNAGWYKRRWVKNGVWVPARIYVEQDIDPVTGLLNSPELFRIEVEGLDGGDPRDHWTYLRPITKAEFDHLTDYRLRDHRMLDSKRSVDLSTAPTIPQGVI